MFIVIIPVAVLLFIVLTKRLPKIGGNIYVALFSTAVLSLLLGGVFSPGAWFRAVLDGIDRLAWVMCLSLFGSIYSEAQVQLGTVNTIMSALQSRFRNSPRALVLCVVFVLVLAGSLLGDAIAASTVVGVLTIGTLVTIGLSAEVIVAIIVMGAAMGSIMPPMTQSIALASTLVGTDPDPVFRLGFPTVAIVVVAVSLYIVFYLLRKANKPVISDNRKASEIILKNWTTLIPLFGLITVVFFRTVNTSWRFDLMPWLLMKIPAGERNLYQVMQTTLVVKGLANGIVLCIIFALALCFCFPKVHRNAGAVFKNGFMNVRRTLLIQLGAACMLGSFYAAGQTEAVQVFAQGLNVGVLIIGGVAAMCLIGMLTGSQTTTQNVVFTFFGPALVSIGNAPIFVALAGAFFAMSGQGMPPADLTTFVVCGLVGGVVGKKVDPIKAMFYALPMCIAMLAMGFIILYLF